MIKKCFVFLFMCIQLIPNVGKESPPYESFYKEQITFLNKKRLMSPKEIQAYNRHLTLKGYILDPLDDKYWISPKTLKTYLLSDLSYIKNHALYDINNRLERSGLIKKKFKRNLGLDTLSKQTRIRRTSGVINKPTHLRLIPTDEYRMAKPNDWSFDVIQISFLNIWDCVDKLHESTDGKWIYVRSSYSRGWIPKDSFVKMSKKKIKQWFASNTLVVTAKRTYLNDATTNRIELNMGDRLPYIQASSVAYKIPVPGKPNESFLLMAMDDVSPHFLRLTQKNIAKQAFKMLGEKYSWGGYLGNTDCSGFIARVYECFGITLPRSSIKQMKAFKKITNVKSNFLGELVPFLSFIQLNGHIMMYLGKNNGHHYVIHNTWKYFTPENKKKIVGKVVITSMDLGRGSKSGTLLKRTKSYGFLPIQKYSL